MKHGMKQRKTTMRKSTTRLLVGGAAGLAALGMVGGAALATGNTPLNVQATDASHVALGTANNNRSKPWGYTTSVHLHAMPRGTVSFQTSGATLEATITASGLTPGSSHIAEMTFKGSQAPIVFSQFAANSSGQVNTTISSDTQASGIPESGTFQIELSTSTNNPIAVAPVRTDLMNQAVHLHAVNPTGYGPLAGHAKLDYNSQAKTLTVTVDATGVEPYSIHAAHIHVGSCAAQGPVLYMLQDLHADSHGRIHQTDVLQDITNFKTPAGGWYLNIHRGESATILDAQGQPTVNFRPLLCADLPATSSARWSRQFGAAPSTTPMSSSNSGSTSSSGGGQSGQGGMASGQSPTMNSQGQSGQGGMASGQSPTMNSQGQSGSGTGSASSPTTTQSAGSTSPSKHAQAYTFRTLDNPADLTFNQLLGINDQGTIAGYFGSGQPGHPNKGYLLPRPYSSYINENFPGSVQTQVTGLNNRGVTVGFWADANNDNFGFAEHNGVFTTYQDPATGTGTVNQLLGVNDSGMAVGFYTDGSGVNHGYEVNLATKQYTEIQVPGGTNTVATGINEEGDITGFSTNANNVTFGWVLHQGHFSTFDFPGSTNTTPLGINAEGEVVGAYVDGAGNTHGFTLTNWLGHGHWATVNDPNGVNSTTVNGVNDFGQLVGFYTDAAGNTDGFLANK